MVAGIRYIPAKAKALPRRGHWLFYHLSIAEVTHMHRTLRCAPAPGHAAELHAQLKQCNTTHQQHGCFMLACCHSALVLASVPVCLHGAFVSQHTHTCFGQK